MIRQRRTALLSVLTAVALAVVGSCGGGGGDDDGGGVSGFMFNDGNMVEGTTAGIDAVSPFPQVSAVSQQLVAAIQSVPVPKRSAGRVLDVPLADLCATGSATVSWDDKDDSNTLSVGDSATLTFTGCQFEGDSASIDGTLDHSFSAVDLPGSLQAMLTLDLQVQDVVDGQVQNETISGSFLMQAATEPGTTLVDVLYGGVDRSDVLTATLNGQTIQFGCFDVAHVFSPSSPDAFSVQARGIANVDGKIMQLGSYFGGGDAPLIFDLVAGFTESVPVSGTLTLLSFDGRPSSDPPRPSCQVVGSPGEVTSDDTYLTVNPLGNGFVQINLYNRTNDLVSQKEIPWNDLN